MNGEADKTNQVRFAGGIHKYARYLRLVLALGTCVFRNCTAPIKVKCVPSFCGPLLDTPFCIYKAFCRDFAMPYVHYAWVTINIIIQNVST